MSGGALRLNRKDSMQDWMESRGFTPLYFFVAITEILFVAITEILFVAIIGRLF